jgi:hypothetical protein
VRFGSVRLSTCLSVTLLVVVAAGLGFMVFPVGGGAIAVAQTSGQVGDAQLVTLSSDAPLPPQARPMPSLAGVAFVAPVIEAGFASQFEGDNGVLMAPAGDELLFLSVDAYSFAPPFGQTGYHYASPLLTVAFSDHVVTLPESPEGTVAGVAGSAYSDDGAYYPGRWVVAVPAGAPVILTAREGPFSQALNLRTEARVGLSPVALYRSPAGPLALDVRPNLAGSLVVSAGSHRVTFPVTVSEDVLSYFRLDSPQPTSGLPANEAYLLVEVSVPAGSDPAGNQYFFDPDDPTAAVTLRLPGRPALRSQFGPSDPGPGEPLDGIFGFVVPATMSAATLSLGIGDGPAVYADNPSDVAPRAVSTAASTSAAFPLQFPPPSTAPLAASGSSVSGTPNATTPSTTVTPSTTASSSHSASLATRAPPSTLTRQGGSESVDAGIAAGAGLVVLVLVLGLVFLRRRGRLPPTPPDQGGAGGSPTDHDDALTGLTPPEPADEHLVAPGGRAGGPADAKAVVAAAAPGGGDVAVSAGLEVRVLGRLEVEGATGPIRRRAVLRALIVLALNEGRTVGSEELRAMLANDEMSVLSAGTLRSELSRLRAVLPDGMFPERETGLGYGFAGPVTVDWTVFKMLAATAKVSVGDDRIAVAMEALRLIRGPVLENGTWHGIDKTVWEIEAAIDSLAGETAVLALEARQPSVAAEAAARGLLAVPGAPRLWQLRLRAAEDGSGENVAVLSGRARRDLGDDLSEPPA